MNKRHGYFTTHKKLYYVWHAMKKRCSNPNSKNYRLYGGRGITYCAEWEDAENFCQWALENGYKEGLELDRIDTNGNYEPINCRWVDRATNARNQRRSVQLEVNGIVKCVSEWERYLGLGKSVINSWVKRFGKEFAQDRIKEILETGTYKRYKKNGVKALLTDKYKENINDSMRIIDSSKAIEIVKEGGKK